MSNLITSTKAAVPSYQALVTNVGTSIENLGASFAAATGTQQFKGIGANALGIAPAPPIRSYTPPAAGGIPAIPPQTGGMNTAVNLNQLGQLAGGALGAVQAGAGGARGGTLGGTVIARGRGMIMIQTPQGHNVIVKTQKRRRQYARGGGGMKMNKLMELAIMKSIIGGR